MDCHPLLLRPILRHFHLAEKVWKILTALACRAHTGFSSIIKSRNSYYSEYIKIDRYEIRIKHSLYLAENGKNYLPGQIISKTCKIMACKDDYAVADFEASVGGFVGHI